MHSKLHGYFPGDEEADLAFCLTLDKGEEDWRVFCFTGRIPQSIGASSPHFICVLQFRSQPPHNAQNISRGQTSNHNHRTPALASSPTVSNKYRTWLRAIHWRKINLADSNPPPQSLLEKHFRSRSQSYVHSWR